MSARQARAAAVYLRPPQAGDQADFLAAALASRALHRPWVSAPSDAAAFASYLKRSQQPDFAGFLICRRSDDALAGVINVSQIVHGPFRSAYLGYYAFQPLCGQGYMTAGMQLLLRHAFTKLRLHRVEANIQPGNVASLALARRCGFRQEGFSPRYLKVGGRWRDHERWALTIEDWRALR